MAMASLFDEDLKKIMGDRYEEEEIPKEMPKMECKPIGPGAQAKPRTKEERREVPPVAEYVKIPAAERGLMDRLASCATWLGICGGISMLMWWFNVNGLMAQVAAYPCILASSCIGTGGVVWNIKK